LGSSTLSPFALLLYGDLLHELERRWNAGLASVRSLEDELEVLIRQRPATLSGEERQRLLQMGADLEEAWHHPAATAITRKRIIRVVLHEVVARVEDDEIQLLLHWRGGDHTRLMVRKNRHATDWKSDAFDRRSRLR
jgi:hypothetical protein